MSPKRTPITKSLEVPWDISKSLTTGLMKIIPSFVTLFFGFLVLDFAVTVWDRWAGASSWRTNTTAENIRASIDELLGDGTNSDAVLRDLFQAVFFGIVTYVSVKRYGKTTLALAAPVTVFVLAALTKFILRQTDKWTWGGSNPSDFGGIFYNWLSGMINDRLLAGVQNDEGNNRGRGGITTMIGLTVGFLAAA